MEMDLSYHPVAPPPAEPTAQVDSRRQWSRAQLIFLATALAALALGLFGELVILPPLAHGTNALAAMINFKGEEVPAWRIAQDYTSASVMSAGLVAVGAIASLLFVVGAVRARRRRRAD
jgi:hypothetical protein